MQRETEDGMQNSFYTTHRDVCSDGRCFTLRRPRTDAQPFQQSQRPQGTAPGRPATSNSPRPPTCFDRLAQQPELVPLAGKVYLGQLDVHSSALFGIQAVPTPAERPLLLKWLAGRRSCLPEMEKILNGGGWSVQAKRAKELSYQIINDMIGDLVEGKLTFSVEPQQ
jgi:hypothetical protein